MDEVQMRRKFTAKDENDKEIELAVKRPTQDVINEADLTYNVHVNKAIRAGSMMRSEAIALIEERGIWTEKDDKASTKMRHDIRDLEKELIGKSIPKKRGTAIAKEIRDLRNKLITHMEKRNTYLNATAEFYAENIRDQYLTASCTVYAESGEPFFEDFDDYLKRANESASIDAYREMVYFLNGFDGEAHKKFTENKYLLKEGLMSDDGFFLDDQGRKITSDGKLINDSFQYVDEDGNLIDEFGNRINEDGDLIIDEGKKKTRKASDKKDATKEEEKEPEPAEMPF